MVKGWGGETDWLWLSDPHSDATCTRWSPGLNLPAQGPHTRPGVLLPLTSTATTSAFPLSFNTVFHLVIDKQKNKQAGGQTEDGGHEALQAGAISLGDHSRNLV